VTEPGSQVFESGGGIHETKPRTYYRRPWRAPYARVWRGVRETSLSTEKLGATCTLHLLRPTNAARDER